MPHFARYSVIASLWLNVRFSSGMLTTAIVTFSLPLHQEHSANRLEEELKNFDMPFCLGHVIAPGVESMSPEQESVCALVLCECLTDLISERRHGLSVFDNRQPLAVLVCLYI